MPFAPELRTHSQKVCTLYKRACRLIEGHHIYRPTIRYHITVLRSQFDKNKNVNDPKESRRLLWLAENEVFLKQNPLPPAKFARSLGLCAGVAHGRIVEPPDWVLDYWHPLEKAQYPEYFKTRETRKCEYIKHWCGCTLC